MPGTGECDAHFEIRAFDVLPRVDVPPLGSLRRRELLGSLETLRARATGKKGCKFRGQAAKVELLDRNPILPAAPMPRLLACHRFRRADYNAYVGWQTSVAPGIALRVFAPR